MRQLYGQKWYTPMEVAKLGLIKSSKGDNGTISGHYNFVLELIKSGELRAKNYSKGKHRQNFLIPESEIAHYHETVSEIT